MTRLIFLMLVCTVALGACASVPISTMARLSGFNEADFAQIDPREIVVRVQVPQEFAIDPKGTTLSVTLVTSGGTDSRTFPLVFAGEDASSRPGGFFSEPIRVRRQSLRLSEPGVELFRLAQRSVGTKTLESFKFNVTWKFSTTPDKASSVRLWVDLQLSVRQGLLPLIRDLSFEFSDANRRSQN